MVIALLSQVCWLAQATDTIKSNPLLNNANNDSIQVDSNDNHHDSHKANDVSICIQKVSLSKDNFYSIVHLAFLDRQEEMSTSLSTIPRSLNVHRDYLSSPKFGPDQEQLGAARASCRNRLLFIRYSYWLVVCHFTKRVEGCVIYKKSGSGLKLWHFSPTWLCPQGKNY